MEQKEQTVITLAKIVFVGIFTANLKAIQEND
jgi:hypothetical protein